MYIYIYIHIYIYTYMHILTPTHITVQRSTPGSGQTSNDGKKAPTSPQREPAQSTDRYATPRPRRRRAADCRLASMTALFAAADRALRLSSGAVAMSRTCGADVPCSEPVE